MKLSLTILLIFLLSVTANTLSIIFGWVIGFLGVIGFNIIFALLPGIVITFKASKNWPNLKILWSLGFGIVPLVLGIAYLIYGEVSLGYPTLIMGIIIVIACSFSVKVALNK